MCTVIFIPKEGKHYFVSLRDEDPNRPKASEPKLFESNGARYLMPKDGLAGGTWVGVSAFKNVIILLNGAFESHQKKSNYAQSRGKIVSDLLVSEMPVVDWQLMDLKNVEPFTLIVWSECNLFELVWDGTKKYRKMVDASVAYIWSSSTLYDMTAKSNREEWFYNWMAMKPPVSKRSVLNFLISVNDSQNGFIINRKEKMKTLSYSFIEFSNSDFASFDYFDLDKYTHSTQNIDFTVKSTKCVFE